MVHVQDALLQSELVLSASDHVLALEAAWCAADAMATTLLASAVRYKRFASRAAPVAPTAPLTETGAVAPACAWFIEGLARAARQRA